MRLCTSRIIQSRFYNRLKILASAGVVRIRTLPCPFVCISIPKSFRECPVTRFDGIPCGWNLLWSGISVQRAVRCLVRHIWGSPASCNSVWGDACHIGSMLRQEQIPRWGVSKGLDSVLLSRGSRHFDAEVCGLRLIRKPCARPRGRYQCTREARNPFSQTLPSAAWIYKACWWHRFNSKLVRLKVNEPCTTTVDTRFQFQTGSIKSPSLLTVAKSSDRFNSKLVRLKGAVKRWSRQSVC